MTYEEYIASPAWAALRQEALARDGFRCRGCDTTENLEVHHRRYGSPLGTETVDDLTTLCGGPEGCHHAITTIIRRRRYKGAAHVVAVASRLTPGKATVTHELPAFEVAAYRRVTPGHAQRPTGEPAEPDGEGPRARHGQAQQD